MNILNKLTLKNLKLNKKRTIVTIIGIMLSTALICAVAGMVTSFQKTLAETAKTRDGNYHVTFKNVPSDEIKYITENKKTKESFLTKDIGYAKLEGSKNDSKPYLLVSEYDKNALKNGGIVVEDGRLPENDKEIVIPRHAIYNGRVNIEVGQKLKLEIGDRERDGKILTQSDPIYDGEGNILEEKLINTKTKEYTVVGIISRLSSEDFSGPGYNSITYMENQSGNQNVSILCKKPGEFKNMINEISGDVSKGDKAKYDYYTNDDLLRWQAANLSDESMAVLYGLAAIIIAIIVVSSVFVIKNSFSISITERIRQYGMFASVGATSKQIKRNVLFEGLILGIIGIPLGILLGIIAILIIIWLVNLILADFLNGIDFMYSVPLIPILISVGVAALTILISSIIPAVKASRVSPIDAIRSSNDIKIKSKKLKTPKWFKKMFKIGGEISYKNLKRSKKKYRTTVVSIVISVSIFIALSSFIQYGFKLTGVYYKDINYNFIVYDQGGSEPDQTYKNFKHISKLDSVENYTILKENSALIDGKHMTDKYVANMNDKQRNDEEYLSILTVDSNVYKEYLKKLGLDNKDLTNQGILLDTFMYYDDKYVEARATNIEINDTIKIKQKDEEDKLVKENSIKVAAITNERMLGLESIGSPSMIVEEETFNNIFDKYYVNEVSIYSNNTEKLSQALDELKSSNNDFNGLSYINIEEDQRAQSAMILVISIFLYGFIAVITLIGVTNIFNTITTNMILRSKEFAMLKSIGMTKKEFNSMIRLESILYGFKSLIIGIPIGIGLSYLMYKIFSSSIEVPYTLPWVAIFISVIFVFIIISITMKYSVNKINKQNIIETIRNDNI